QRMRTSTNHGKILAVICAGLLLTIALASVCFLFVLFHKPSLPQSRIATLNSQKPGSKSQISELKSQVSTAAVVQPQSLRDAETRREREELREERERKMERESEEMRERYDKPDEAARYLLNRRLPEGETELRFELYLNALD